jgi:ferredoxin-NADP reductase
VLLVAGGSGVVPLMAMIRANTNKVPVRLIYSVRSPSDVLYGPELSERARVSPLTLTYLYTRAAPAGMPTGRINADTVAAAGWPPDSKPAVFVCGPTGFVEAAANLLVAAGHDPAAVKTERFGPTS